MEPTGMLTWPPTVYCCLLDPFSTRAVNWVSWLSQGVFQDAARFHWCIVALDWIFIGLIIYKNLSPANHNYCYVSE